MQLENKLKHTGYAILILPLLVLMALNLNAQTNEMSYSSLMQTSNRSYIGIRRNTETTILCMKQPGILRVSAEAMPFERAVAATNDVVWKKYYKKMKSKAVAQTAIGSTFLISGMGMLVSGIGLWNIGYVNTSYSYYAFNTNAAYNHAQQQKGIGDILMGFGAACTLIGTIITPIGVKNLHKVRRIKRDAEAHDILISLLPDINPATQYYACSININL